MALCMAHEATGCWTKEHDVKTFPCTFATAHDSADTNGKESRLDALPEKL